MCLGLHAPFGSFIFFIVRACHHLWGYTGPEVRQGGKTTIDIPMQTCNVNVDNKHILHKYLFWFNTHVYLLLCFCLFVFHQSYFVKDTVLFKINRNLLFTYKISSFCRIDLPFGGHHIYPIHGVPCKLGISWILSL